tara:strand:- start:408 stop:515 length:108 start_codon:yes stop_codon:yes gene_type:complete
VYIFAMWEKLKNLFKKKPEKVDEKRLKKEKRPKKN